MKVAVCRPLTPCHLGKRQAASPPRTPQPPRLPHPAVSRGVPPGLPAELAGRPRPNRPAQSQGPAAVTSESRPLRRRAPSRQAARGPVYPLKVTRGFMPLYLSGFPERQHVARAPRLVRRQNTHVDLDPATPQRIGHHTDRDLTRRHVKHISSRNSIQSQQTALKAFRLAVRPEGRRAAAKSGYSRSGGSWAGGAYPDPAPARWCCCAPGELP